MLNKLAVRNQLNQIYTHFIKQLNALKKQQNAIIDDFIKQINELKLRGIRNKIAKMRK